MAAVAPPPNFQNRWSGSDGVPTGATPMGSDEYRMFMPRKSAQRTNSSSSLSSQASSTSTLSTTSSQPNGVAPVPAADGSTWAARKKGPRGLWPASKTEPVSGISNARPQSIATAGSGPSATSAMTALHGPAPMVPSQTNGTMQQQQNGLSRPQGAEPSAILHLIPMNGGFERKTITVPFFPDVLRIGRQTNNKTIPTPLNGYFDSKVLSRQHAEIWADRNGKIWIRDVKSSNGTFVNGQRLSPENRDSDPHELREQDMLELGIDIVSEDQKTIVHHKVAARVEHAGIYSNTSNSMMDLNFGEAEGSQPSNLAGPGGPQQLTQMRGRALGQGSLSAQRMQGANGQVAGNNNIPGMQQPRHPNFWLQPVTMEQVVKRLTAEMKAAKQQSQDLHQTSQYINSVLHAEPKQESSKNSPTNAVRISPIKDLSLKARFSGPPAPPPQQPLPEKPIAAPSILKRVDTERPKSLGSPISPDPQMIGLTEALQHAKKEMETQNLRLRDLEAMLSEERRAREDAEERADRLERERQATDFSRTNGHLHSDSKAADDDSNSEIIVANGSASSQLTDAATTRLQQRLDTMISEMTEMKVQMQKYRERAETAEADRKSLAEMIESIRHKDAKKPVGNPLRRSRSGSDDTRDGAAPVDGEGVAGDDAEEGEITIINERDVDDDHTEALIRRAVQNGGTIEPGSRTKSPNALAIRSTRHDTLAQTAPAVSILTVVALGVAVMAWLNNYPKIER